MIKVAVTGNIGSGKSTVCKIFESLGIKVYYADPEAKKFYENPEVISSVKALFGKDVFDENDRLIQKRLAAIVFEDELLLGKLNKIIHPLVLDDFLQWTEKQSDSEYIVYESALLFESGFYRFFDECILVSTPVEVAMDRVLARDNISKEEFNARAARQSPESEKRDLADHIILNDGATALIPQVVALHKQFSKQ